MMNIRAASENDLAAMYLVYYLNEVGEAGSLPEPSPQIVTPMLHHIFETGTMYVADHFFDARCYIPSGSDLF